MPSKVRDKRRTKAQKNGTECLKMKQQNDNEVLDMCKTEGIPIYTNYEYGLFGHLEVHMGSDESWGGKGD